MWDGAINGRSLSPGDLGNSLTNQRGIFSYSQINTALQRDSKSAADALAVTNMPATYPISGAPFVMSNAEAKALGPARRQCHGNRWVNGSIHLRSQQSGGLR